VGGLGEGGGDEEVVSCVLDPLDLHVRWGVFGVVDFSPNSGPLSWLAMVCYDAGSL